MFNDLEDVRQITEKFIHDYNEVRPHESLNNLSPIMWKYGRQRQTQTYAVPDHIPRLENSNNNYEIK